MIEIRFATDVGGHAAISIPGGALPVDRYIRGPRYRVTFDRAEGGTPNQAGVDASYVRSFMLVDTTTVPRRSRTIAGRLLALRDRAVGWWRHLMTLRRARRARRDLRGLRELAAEVDAFIAEHDGAPE